MNCWLQFITVPTRSEVRPIAIAFIIKNSFIFWLFRIFILDIFANYFRLIVFRNDSNWSFSTCIFYGFGFWPFIELFLGDSSLTWQLYTLWKSFPAEHDDSIKTFRTDIPIRCVFHEVYAILLFLVHARVCFFSPILIFVFASTI